MAHELVLRRKDSSRDVDTSRISKNIVRVAENSDWTKATIDVLEFDIDKRIDPHALDTECMKMPELFFKWCEKAITARGEADRLKLKAETIRSELEMKVRKRPDRYGIDKATEAAVKATVDQLPEYLGAVEAHLDARDNSAILDKAVAAMEIKKRMLETLVTLHGQQYFAGPSTPRNLGQVWLDQQRVAEERVNERQARVARKRVPRDEDE